MPSAGLAAIVIACAYLAGSIPFGLLIARARGVDVRAIGSGNIGATNVARALGKKTGALVLFLDALKGALPTLAARWLVPDEPWVIAAAALAAILGHVFPIWLKLRGGKGVATALGVFLALAPSASGLAFIGFAAVYLPTRIVSLGSLTGATIMPIAMQLLGAPAPFVGLAVLAWLLIVVRHRGNIGRLLRREESRLK